MTESSRSAAPAPGTTSPVALAKVPPNLREMSPEQLDAWADQVYDQAVAALQQK